MNQPIAYSGNGNDRAYQPGLVPPGTHRTAEYRRLCAGAVLFVVCLSGCTSFGEYFHNGFKVGPNYGRPPAFVAEQWIDASDRRIRSETDDISHWWAVFNDPVLNNLVQSTYQQNLTLREAGFRVLEARAQRGIAVGLLFPQTQVANGGYTRTGVSVNVANRVATPQRWFDTWAAGFGLAWELDFWGRFRRAIESANAELDASVENYDAVLVTLLGDVATEYVEIRARDRQIALARESLGVFERVLSVSEQRFKAERTTKVSYDLSLANVAQTQALIADLEILRRESEIRLCILLGIPPQDLRQMLGEAPIPIPPGEVAVGIPADLLRRRPDVRKAEREAAAQSARIGIAESDFYPAISIVGTLGVASQNFSNLFDPDSFRGTINPGFTWNILNYGRILNNVRAQDAKFNELIARYQQTVLVANGEVESELIRFLKSQVRAKALTDSAEAWRDALKLVTSQYEAGAIDIIPVAYTQQNQLLQQNDAINAQFDLVRALIGVYRALGGGWEIRLDPGEVGPIFIVPEASSQPGLPEQLPVPPQGAPIP
jgi:NodT family efflux transporter outer membrane factor (OMF) lipoprotein